MLFRSARLIIVKYYKGVCTECGKKTRVHDRMVHHKIEFHKFNGDIEKANAFDNLTLLCRHCHSMIHGFGRILKGVRVQ